MNVTIAVICYSATGHTHRLAEAVAEGAADAGADVRLRRVRELAPDEAIDRNPAWRRHATATRHVPEAELADLDWAHGLAFGSPTRYGNPYGSTWVSGSLRDPDARTLRVARHQGGRLVQWALRAVTAPVTSGV